MLLLAHPNYLPRRGSCYERKQTMIDFYPVLLPGRAMTVKCMLVRVPATAGLGSAKAPEEAIELSSYPHGPPTHAKLSARRLGY